MKEMWQRYAARIDALGLRERVLVFLGAAALLIQICYSTLLAPLSAQESAYSSQIEQDRSQTLGLQTEMRATLANAGRNPDAAKQAQLKQLKDQLATMRASLEDMQKGLVSSDRMTGLLEDILKRNNRLHLVSLHTLPVEDIAGSDASTADKHADAAPKATASKDALASPVSGVYRHGVEIVVEGSYLDMVDYMTQLEAIPWRLYWGSARMETDNTNTKLKLTLTLYTMSLEKKWLDL